MVKYSFDIQLSNKQLSGFVESNRFKDIFNYVELQQIYGLTRHQSNGFFSFERGLY